MIDVIEESLDVHVQHPVSAPASLPGYSQGIVRRFVRAVAIGVIVELWLQNRLQPVFDHHLRDAIRDRRYPQRSRSTRRLGYLNTLNCWRHIAARGHSVPDLVQVPHEVLVKFLNRLAIDSGTAFVGFYLLVRAPDSLSG